MALLFETFDDIKPFISGANVNNDIATLEGYIASAADEYMVPLLGQEFWDEFTTAYNENELSSAQQALMPYMQRPLAHFAYHELAKDGGLVIGDEGIGALQAGNIVKPAQWQVRDFRRTRLKHGWSAMQALLKYLWTNKADFDTWKDSDERVDLWKTVIWDVNRWNKHRKLEGFGTLWALQAYTKATIENEISASLGEEFAAEILDWLVDANVDADLTALLPYIERCVVYGSLYRAANDLPLQITAQGIYLDEVDRGLQNDELQKVAQNKLAQLAGTCSKEYEAAIAKMRKYLDQQAAANKYQTYFESDLYNADADTATPPTGLSEGPTFMM